MGGVGRRTVEVLARVGEHPVAVRAGAVLATSFHPEITGDDRVHALFLQWCGIAELARCRSNSVVRPACDQVARWCRDAPMNSGYHRQLRTTTGKTSGYHLGHRSAVDGSGPARDVGSEPGARPLTVGVAPTGGRRRAGLVEYGISGHITTRGTKRSMSGHSKWATTKHQKAAKDAKRGKLFAKLIKNIEVAARTGGGDPDGNPTLFDAIQKAKKSSVPNENIDRAVKRGSGAEAGGVDYQSITYEGYGPNGVAIMIECLTDNRNRAASEVRVAVTRNGGNMADPGSVVVPVQPQGRGHRARRPADADRGRPDAGRAGRRCRGDQRPRRVFEVVSEADRPGRGADRRHGRRASSTTRPTRPSSPRSTFRWTSTAPAR